MSLDGKRVATAGQHSLIRLWDTATWKPILPPRGLQHNPYRLEESRDGKYAAAGTGFRVHVWALGSGQEVCEVRSNHDGGYGRIHCFSPEESLVMK